MHTVVTTLAVGQGYNYTVYFGCEKDDDGVIQTETADDTKQGWAATQEQAAEKGKKVARNRLEN